MGEDLGEGSLTDNQVYSLAEDVENEIWIGMNDGVNYLVNPFGVLSNQRVDASLPIFQQRILLDETRITAIAVDGGNRKWMGTANGVFVIGDNGDTLYNHFTAENSPLPSNQINAITIQQQTGEVFIATDRGLVSYRSGSTAGTDTQAETIKVFPNPVRPGYLGQVGISGLVRDASVKITNTAGFLVRELPAQGGTAAWDQRNSNGQLVSPGVYLIFIANFDGSESLVGKVAVVR